MGSPLSPVVANLFMEEFETSAPLKPSFYRRYVDDTLLVWPHGRAKLEEFLDFLKKQHPSIQFTVEIETGGHVSFLDILIY